MEARARELWTSQQMTKQERKRYAPSRGPVVPFLEEIELLHPPMLAREGCECEDIAREALWCGAISARDAFRSSLRISIVRWRARIHSFGCVSQRRIRCECEGHECAAVAVEVESMKMRRQ